MWLLLCRRKEEESYFLTYSVLDYFYSCLILKHVFQFFLLRLRDSGANYALEEFVLEYATDELVISYNISLDAHSVFDVGFYGPDYLVVFRVAFRFYFSMRAYAEYPSS
jgi:hypothetical protein